MVEMPRIQQFHPVDAGAAGTTLLRRGKRATIALVGLCGFAAAIYYGVDYYRFRRFLVTTDDAYVEADSTIVAPKISGYISEVLVADNERVAIGQILAKIDDSDFQVALAQANAALAASEAQIGNLSAQMDLQNAEIEQARALVASAQAALAFADQDAARYRDLAHSGAGTLQRAQQSEAGRAEAAAKLDHDKAALASAERKQHVLAASLTEARARRSRAEADVRQAQLNLGYTTIRAAVTGTVGARTLRVGQYVSAGTQLMAVVPLHSAYVVANFKETQVGDLRPGQPVQISIDALPDARLSGRVDSLAPASGQEFALLPPDNATGNFTKVVQRIPVKIVFNESGDVRRLRAGMSVEPAVDTRPASPPRIALSSAP